MDSLSSAKDHCVKLPQISFVIMYDQDKQSEMPFGYDEVDIQREEEEEKKSFENFIGNLK